MTASDIYLETMRACIAEVLGTPKGDERGQTLLPTKASKDRPCEVIDFLQARERLRNFAQ